MFRLGIDVGGTFTDLVLIDDVGHRMFLEKVLTTPSDPSVGILNGLRRLLPHGVAMADVQDVVHGTTVVANALIERKGATTALVATEGFRDTLQIRREVRYDTFDPNIVFPEPLVRRELRRGVTERVLHDGTVAVELDVEAAQKAVEDLASLGVEAIAVCLLHSYANSRHEKIIEGIIREVLATIPISVSSEVFPQLREYERTSVTVANAYVQPLAKRYLRRLNNGLKELGLEAEVRIMSSFGGSLTVETAEDHPIRLLESGPAAGVLAAAHLASRMEKRDVIAFDMGGTTAKACIVRGGHHMVTTDFEVARVHRFKKGSGLPIPLPTIDLLEVGAGGGSIAEVDELGLIRVGPRSAGAAPGPACYGLGGTEATVTDANLVLGYLDAGYFLGGEMRLDFDAASKSIERSVAQPLGLDVVEAAWGINQIVTQNMAEAIRVHSVEKNVDTRQYALVSFGGAGPIHAHAIAKALGMRSVLYPRAAGVLSAFGLLLAPTSFDFSRTYVKQVIDLSPTDVNRIYSELESEGIRLLNQAGVQDIALARSLDMCYQGQGFEVNVPIQGGAMSQGDVDRLTVLFNEVYEEKYGRRITDVPVVAVTWRVLASGPRPKTEGSFGQENGNGSQSPPLKGGRKVFFGDSGWVDCEVYDRAKLKAGTELTGPAVVEERESTAVVPCGARLIVDGNANLIVAI